MTCHSLLRVLKPFNDRAGLHIGLHIGRHILGNNLPASIARELFKPSTDSESLIVSILNKLFNFSVVFSLGDVTKRACFLIFDQL